MQRNMEHKAVHTDHKTSDNAYPNQDRRKLNRPLCIILGVSMGILALIIAILIIYFVGVKGSSSSGPGSPVNEEGFDPDGSPLEFFKTDDALDVIWMHGCNSQADLQEALDGDYMMIEGDITFRWFGHPNQTDELIMAHPPDVDSDLTMDEWLEGILERDDKGLKLDLKSEELFVPALSLLESKADRVSHPVWTNADVVNGPGTMQPPLDVDEFLEAVNAHFPRQTLSLGWTTGCCLVPFTREMMEEMWDIVKNITQPVSFPARAALFKRSWEHFKWLLMQDPDRFSITVWTPKGVEDWEGATPYDLLYCRNDVDKKYIYYDLPGEQLDEFKSLSITAGNVFNHFSTETRDGLNISWAHAVNSQQELQDALDSDVMMLEGDVVLQGFGTENETDIPIMAHPPDIYSDITLEEWVDRVMLTQKGIKLDFKSVEVLEPAMKLLESRKKDFVQPVWINADIFKGPNAPFSTPVNATEFRRIVLDYFPESTLSIGWTTGWNNLPIDGGYTQEMIDEMAEYAEDLVQPITYPIRAAMVKESWDVLKPLLDISRAYTMTIWSSTNDNVDADDLVYVRENYDIDRVYYDLPDDLMEEFLKRLNMTSAF